MERYCEEERRRGEAKSRSPFGKPPAKIRKAILPLARQMGYHPVRRNSMMLAIRAHFDGSVIIPDEPIDLPRGQELVFHVDNPAMPRAAGGVAGQSLLRFSGTMAKDDLERMRQAISEGCEQVRADEW